jgi:glyoxylase-like metal-dependent hydrolase (beta-lactamase superfamily II)
MSTKRYQWMVIQEGTLALRPSGTIMHSLEHRPTSTLIWPESEQPSRENTILTDPYFTRSSFQTAEMLLKQVSITFEDIGRIFVTHAHFDHLPHFPVYDLKFERFEPSDDGKFAGIRAVSCPGHADDLRALVFTSPDDEQIWIVADAVLDEEWLRAWRYYWPNGYSSAEIIQTWRSVAAILMWADVVVPGHGAAIRPTSGLIADLAAGFPQAECAADCPDVLAGLRGRLQKFTPSP